MEHDIVVVVDVAVVIIVRVSVVARDACLAVAGLPGREVGPSTTFSRLKSTKTVSISFSPYWEDPGAEIEATHKSCAGRVALGERASGLAAKLMKQHETQAHPASLSSAASPISGEDGF
ncbi:MAG: hypothetical protein IT424_03790 [Pirellulales bacterium]|nr:hypothetical protein [Pirellulales bacterium]